MGRIPSDVVETSSAMNCRSIPSKFFFRLGGDASGQADAGPLITILIIRYVDRRDTNSCSVLLHHLVINFRAWSIAFPIPRPHVGERTIVERIARDAHTNISTAPCNTQNIPGWNINKYKFTEEIWKKPEGREREREREEKTGFRYVATAAQSQDDDSIQLSLKLSWRSAWQWESRSGHRPVSSSTTWFAALATRSTDIQVVPYSIRFKWEIIRCKFLLKNRRNVKRWTKRVLQDVTTARKPS